MRPDDPRHGTRSGYTAHRNDGEDACAACKAACAKAVARRELAKLEGRPTSYPSLHVTRRLQALVALGWSITEIATRAGMARNYLDDLERNGRRFVQVPTFVRVAAVYEELCMTPAPDSYGATRARARAQRRGYAPPLAWDDIDDPDEVPQGYSNFRRTPPSRVPAACGTDSGYYRHRRLRNEPACQPCLDAHRDYERQRKEVVA